MHMCRRVIETSLSELRTYYVGVWLTGYALLVAMHVCMYVCTHIIIIMLAIKFHVCSAQKDTGVVF